MEVLGDLIRFDVSSVKFSKLLDESTALLDLQVCTSGNNAHNLPFTKETMIRAAEKTLRGKPIVAEYSMWRGDIGTHTRPEESNRIGYFVENQDFRYVDNPDGTCSLCAYAILWKDYAPNEYMCIAEGKDSTKGVSMEIRWNKKKQGFEGNMELEEITDFSFRGVAILGDKYVPASAGSNAHMVVFSERVKETEMKYFADNQIKINNSKDSAINSSSWSNPGRKLYGKILKATNSKSLLDEAYLVVESGYEDSPSSSLKYPHHSIKNGELVVNIAGLKAAFSRAEQQGIVSGNVKSHLLKHYHELGLDTENFTQKEEKNLENENKEKVMMEQGSENTEKPDEANMAEGATEGEEKKENMSCGGAGKNMEDDECDEDYAKKIEEFEAKMKEANEKIANYEAELEELRKYKKEREDADKNFAIESVIADVIDIMPKEEIEKFRIRAKDISFAQVEGFKNEIKARALDFAVNDENKRENRMAVQSNGENKNKKRFW